MSDVSSMRRHESDHEIPWALPIVVVRDKHALASESEVCELSATAVVRLLDDARSAPGGPWHEAVEYWREGAIRKVVRRADGKRWGDVQSLPGVTVERAGPRHAAVRAFVPGPVTPLPKELGKLQVGGTDFPAADGSETAAPVVVWVSPHIEITSGKAAAQCAHAAQLAFESLTGQGGSLLERWREGGFSVRVEWPSVADWERAESQIQVFDAGFTELDGVTETARAYW